MCLGLETCAECPETFICLKVCWLCWSPTEATFWNWFFWFHAFPRRYSMISLVNYLFASCFGLLIDIPFRCAHNGVLRIRKLTSMPVSIRLLGHLKMIWGSFKGFCSLEVRSVPLMNFIHCAPPHFEFSIMGDMVHISFRTWVFLITLMFPMFYLSA